MTNRETKDAADKATVQFYAQLSEMSEDGKLPPDDATLMMKVGDVRAIIRDRNRTWQPTGVIYD